jgi:hypothetical protein
MGRWLDTDAIDQRSVSTEPPESVAESTMCALAVALAVAVASSWTL